MSLAMDEKIILKVINHFEKDEPLPESVEITEVRDIKREVEVMMEAAAEDLKATEDNPDDAKFEVFEEIGGLLPTPGVLLENKKGQGVVSLPLRLISFTYNGNPQRIGANYKWFVFFNPVVAEEALNLSLEE